MGNMNWILLPFWNSSIWNSAQTYSLWNAWSNSLLDFLSKDFFKKAQWWKASFKKCFYKGKILKRLESLCMLTYPAVTIIASSCKIMIRKMFFHSQHFLLFSVRTDCCSTICTEFAPAVSEIQHRKGKKSFTLQIQQQKVLLMSLARDSQYNKGLVSGYVTLDDGVTC